MSISELLQFSISSGLGGSGKVYGIVAAVGCCLLLLFVRYLMNKKWSGGTKVMVFQSVLCGLVVVSWFGLKEARQYIETEKGELESFLESAPEWRADALGRAWDELGADGAQGGLTPPEDGGVQIRLRDNKEAEKYTRFIAEVVEKEIQAIAPNGVLIDLIGKEDVAAAVFDMNQVAAMDYSRPVDQGNMLEALVLEHRLAEYAKDYNTEVADGTPRVTPILLIAAFAPLVVSIIFIGRRAWDDLMSFA